MHDLLLRQARLANVAFAYEWLRRFAARAARAHLHGTFTLRDGDLADGRPWPTLTADQASHAVLEEHFLEEDVVELSDILTFLDDGERMPERVFELAEVEQAILPALRRELEGAGVPPQESATSSGSVTGAE